MKKALLFLCLTAVFSLLFLPRGSTQENMRVNLKDGSVIEMAIDDIRKLTFDLTTTWVSGVIAAALTKWVWPLSVRRVLPF